MQWTRNYEPDSQNNKLYTRALIITLAGNVLLAVGKGVAAYLSNSAALYADAANSVSDVAYSLLIVLGIWVALRPPDLSHPQGHGRFEPLVGMAITFSMGLAGYEAARTSIERLMQGGLSIQPGLPTLTLMASAAVKAGMFLLIRQLALRLNSPTLRTTARDNLNDVLTSSAAFVGALGSFYFHPLFDPVAGLLVSAYIFLSAIRAGRENLNFLTGSGASEELRQRLVDAAESVEGVQQVHQTIAEYSGPRLVVDMHVNVAANLSFEEAHRINDEIVEHLQEIPEVDRAYVHLEPEGAGLEDWQEEKDGSD